MGVWVWGVVLEVMCLAVNTIYIYIHVLAFRNLLLEDNMGGEEKTVQT